MFHKKYSFIQYIFCLYFVLSAQQVVAETIDSSSKLSFSQVSKNCNSLHRQDELYFNLCNAWVFSKENLEAVWKISSYYGTINEIQQLSPIEFSFYQKSSFRFNKIDYDVQIYPTSWIRIINKKTMLSQDYVCKVEACSKYFAGNFVDEKIIAENPKAEQKLQQFLSTLPVNKKTKPVTSLNHLNRTTKNDVKVKIYLSSTLKPNEGLISVTRYVPHAAPLKGAIQALMEGVTESEKQNGLYTPKFLDVGTTFTTVIRNSIAYINFNSYGFLNIHMTGNDIDDFESAVYETAKQFKTVKQVQICVDGMLNFKMGFLTNAETTPCPP